MSTDARLPDGVRRLASGKYNARVVVDGDRRSRTFAKLADARAWRVRQLAESDAHAAGRAPKAAAPTLGEVAAAHMRAVRPDLADNTFKVYRRLWAAHMDPSVGGRPGTAHALVSTPVDQITPAAIEALRNDLLARTGPAAARKIMVLVGAMLSRAVRDGHCDRNPTAGIKRPSGKRQRVVWPVTPADVERIRAELAQPADRLMVSVLAYSGMRPGEARLLRFEDVGERSIAVHASKTGRSRSVRLLAPLAADLRAWSEATGRTHGPVFARADGEPWTETDWNHYAHRRLMPAVRAAGVKLGRPYDLRHSAASLWLREGHDVVKVAAWLGHSIAELSRTYAHVIGDLDDDGRVSAETLIADARGRLPEAA